MAAVLGAGPGAVLSHRSAAALWEVADLAGPVNVSIRGAAPRRPGATIVHRRPSLRPSDLTSRHEIPTTGIVQTLVDLATELPLTALERAVNEADRRDLVDPDELRAALVGHRGRPGVRPLRMMLDKHTFRFTDSELERRFLALARRAGLPLPETQRRVNGFRVDFHWPDVGLVVETDGLRYHRTPAQQARDRERDQTHLAAGLTPLRFTHSQVHYEPARVVSLLKSVAAR